MWFFTWWKYDNKTFISEQNVVLKMESFALQSRMYPYAGGKACTPSEALHSTFLGSCVQRCVTFCYQAHSRWCCWNTCTFPKGKNFHFIFVYFCRILKVLGRNVRDFLSNLDNLHEYLRFSYPKIKPPSFFVTDESVDGITLHYRSKRRGYKNYVKGQVSMTPMPQPIVSFKRINNS